MVTKKTDSSGSHPVGDFAMFQTTSLNRQRQDVRLVLLLSLGSVGLNEINTAITYHNYGFLVDICIHEIP